jgi:hypothetical protein
MFALTTELKGLKQQQQNMGPVNSVPHAIEGQPQWYMQYCATVCISHMKSAQFFFAYVLDIL